MKVQDRVKERQSSVTTLWPHLKRTNKCVETLLEQLSLRGDLLEEVDLPCCELEERGGGGVLEKEADGGGRGVSAWGMRFALSSVSC